MVSPRRVARSGSKPVQMRLAGGKDGAAEWDRSVSQLVEVPDCELVEDFVLEVWALLTLPNSPFRFSCALLS